MIENPLYTFVEFKQELGYPCDRELEAYDLYYEQVMVCCECERPATYLTEDNDLLCEDCIEDSVTPSSIHFANFCKPLVKKNASTYGSKYKTR